MKTKKLLPAHFIFGFLIGAANTMPGLSGGSVAFILGIYERLIKALANIKPRYMLKLIRAKNWPELSKELDFYFLSLLLLGALAGVFVFSLFIPYLVGTYPAHMNSLFLGLMIASIPHIFSIYEQQPGLWDWLLMGVVTMGTVYFCTRTGSFILDHSLFQFVCGALAIMAMLLPGISGSFVLVLLGNYQFVFSRVNRLFYFDLNAALSLLPFVGGVLCGVFIFVKMVSYCLANFRRPTLGVLIGLMVGSLPSLWPYSPLPRSLGLEEALMLLLLLSGMAITFLSIRATVK